MSSSSKAVGQKGNSKRSSSSSSAQRNGPPAIHPSGFPVPASFPAATQQMMLARIPPQMGMINPMMNSPMLLHPSMQVPAAGFYPNGVPFPPGLFPIPAAGAPQLPAFYNYPLVPAPVVPNPMLRGYHMHPPQILMAMPRPAQITGNTNNPGMMSSGNSTAVPPRQPQQQQQQNKSEKIKKKRNVTPIEKKRNVIPPWERDRQRTKDILSMLQELHGETEEKLGLSREIVNKFDRYPETGLLDKATDLVTTWGPLMKCIFSSPAEWDPYWTYVDRPVELFFYFRNHSEGPNAFFCSETGSLAKQNNIPRWNSLALSHCDLNEPEFLELFTQLGVFGTDLHELRIGATLADSSHLMPGSRRRRKPIFPQMKERTTEDVSKETMSNCLATVLRSGAAKNLRIITITSDRFPARALEMVAIAEALKESGTAQQLRTIRMVSYYHNDTNPDPEPATPEEVSAWRSLLQHNLSLEGLPGLGVGKDEAVRNYLYLNRMGRAKAAQTSGGEDLVDLLRINRKGDRKKCTAQNRCNLIYGLLREAPGLWAPLAAENSSTSTNPPSSQTKKKARKRKITAPAQPTRTLPQRKMRSRRKS